MPISDNTFDAAELRSALDANPKLADTLTGFVLDDSNAQAPWRQSIRSRFVDPAFSEHYQLLDKDVETLTGVKKNGGEKTVDYMKRAFGEVSTGSTTKMQELTQQLEEAKKLGGSAAEQAALVQQLKDELKKKDTEFTTYKTEAEQRERDSRSGGDIEAGLSAIRKEYRDDIPKEAIEALEQAQKAALMKSVKFQQDGVMTYTDAEGKPLLDTKTNYLPMKAEAILRERMKSVIKEPDQQRQGGGTQGSGYDTGDKDKDGKRLTVPETVKTRVQLGDWLVGKGYKEGSDEYNKLYSKIQEAKKYPVS